MIAVVTTRRKRERICGICGKTFNPPQFFGFCHTCTACAKGEVTAAGLRLDGYLIEINAIVNDTDARPAQPRNARTTRCAHGMAPRLCVVPTCAHWDGKKTEREGRVNPNRVRRKPCEVCGRFVAVHRKRTGRRFCSANCERIGVWRCK
jgi:hypothetical protein